MAIPISLPGALPMLNTRLDSVTLKQTSFIIKDAIFHRSQSTVIEQFLAAIKQ